MKNKIISIVFKKELLDIFRDKKTLMISILIPLLLFPVMFTLIGKGISKNTTEVMENLEIAIVDKGNSNIREFIKSQKNVTIIESANIKDDIKNGKIKLAIEIPENFEEKIKNEEISNIIVSYDDVSQSSNVTLGAVKDIIEEYSKEIVSERLKAKNIDQSILTPIQINENKIGEKDDGGTKIMLSILLPFLLVMYCVSGPIPAATDLGAGEKERGTLEPLLTTQAGRMSLLYGKFLAITVLGMLTTAASLGGLLISFNMSSKYFAGSDVNAPLNFSLDIKVIIIIFILAVLTTMVFGALELAISIYARSFKEAQTYMTPLTIIAIIPAYATYMLDVKSIANFYFHIPLANIICILKELISGVYNIQHIAITLVWTIIYVLSSLLIARYMFMKEEVIFRT
ncbi:MAG: ABC transporter permease [Clostridium argentinense]|uniref:ABC transporter permease n=1 Tax=Clostridium faecium TaxID=2762223 RepID=A0ABR8YRF1_9CLOT|nr:MULTISPECIES: ABC transporter permease [Clostridium]MBD8046804.1 ABC transporter permease [Clostridium faecium]MBS5824497.1 ABC transporter permease [Clostridium argentinense]